MPCLCRKSAVPPVATTLKPRSSSRFTGFTIWALSWSLTDTNTTPSSGTLLPAPSCDLAKARPKSESRPMTSPVERHLGSQDHVDAGEAGEREDRFLDRDVLAARLLDGERLQRFAGHQAGGIFGDRLAGRLGDERQPCGWRAD